MNTDNFRNPPLAEILILLGSNSKKRIVVFEGSSDAALWAKHIEFAHHKADTVFVRGKEEVLENVQEALEIYPDRVIGIVDRDYGENLRFADDGFSGIISSVHNDIELDILLLGNFFTCLEPSLSENSLRRNNLAVEDMFRLSVDAASAIGVLRKLNWEDNTDIDFKCYEVKSRDFDLRLLPHGEWFKIQSLIQKILTAPVNRGKVENRDVMVQRCITVYNSTDNKLTLCRGHDVSGIIATFFNSLKKSDRSSRNLHDINDLILGHVTSADFKNLALYSDLIDWLEYRNEEQLNTQPQEG